jgi:hypothetical protein
MTEESAAEHPKVYGVELEKVLGTDEIREDLRGSDVMFFHAHCTGAIEAYFDKAQMHFGPLSAKAHRSTPCRKRRRPHAAGSLSASNVK